MSADNEGGVIDLQVEYFIRQSGGTIVNRYEDLTPSLLSRTPAAPAVPLVTPRGACARLSRNPRP